MLTMVTGKLYLEENNLGKEKGNSNSLHMLWEGIRKLKGGKYRKAKEKNILTNWQRNKKNETNRTAGNAKDNHLWRTITVKN